MRLDPNAVLRHSHGQGARGSAASGARGPWLVSRCCRMTPAYSCHLRSPSPGRETDVPPTWMPRACRRLHCWARAPRAPVMLLGPLSGPVGRACYSHFSAEKTEVQGLSCSEQRGHVALHLRLRAERRAGVSALPMGSDETEAPAERLAVPARRRHLQCGDSDVWSVAPGAQGARVPAQRALAAASTGAWARNAPGELGLPARSSLNLAFPRCSAVLRAPRHSGPFCLCASVPVLSALRPSWGHPLVFPESARTRPQQASQLGHFFLSVTRGFLVPPVLTARTTCDLFFHHPPSLAAPRILITSEWRPQSSDRITERHLRSGETLWTTRIS